MSHRQSPATLGNLKEKKTIVRSPQPSDLGKLVNGNALIKREIKIKGKNWIQELRRRVYELKLGSILESVLGITERLNIPAGLIFDIWVAGSLQVNQLGMGVNLLYQLPQASLLLLISNTGGFLGGNKEALKWDLVGIP